MARFTVVVARDVPNAYAELAQALSGEDVRIVVDRRRPRGDSAATPSRLTLCERRGRAARPAAAAPTAS